VSFGPEKSVPTFQTVKSEERFSQTPLLQKSSSFPIGKADLRPRLLEYDPTLLCLAAEQTLGLAGVCSC
jgi:hypothetical protein